MSDLCVTVLKVVPSVTSPRSVGRMFEQPCLTEQGLSCSANLPPSAVCPFTLGLLNQLHQEEQISFSYGERISDSIWKMRTMMTAASCIHTHIIAMCVYRQPEPLCEIWYARGSQIEGSHYDSVIRMSLCPDVDCIRMHMWICSTA